MSRLPDNSMIPLTPGWACFQQDGFTTFTCGPCRITVHARTGVTVDAPRHCDPGAPDTGLTLDQQVLATVRRLDEARYNPSAAARAIFEAAPHETITAFAGTLKTTRVRVSEAMRGTVYGDRRRAVSWDTVTRWLEALGRAGHPMELSVDGDGWVSVKLGSTVPW